MSHLWLRAEYKVSEQRAPLSPADVKLLIEHGHRVTVEQSAQRVFPIESYAAVGCNIVPSGTWLHAPSDAYIIGLKHLPENTNPLKHRHIYFAHAFKNQSHAKKLLSRFAQGNGILYDLEYLVDSAGERVVAFGFYAGVAGAAISILLWCLKKCGQKPPYKIPHAYSKLDDVFSDLQELLKSVGSLPSMLIIGAYGRSGSGASHFVRRLGINPVLWGRKDTKCRAVNHAILNFDITLNCIFVDETTTPFLTQNDFINNQNLSIIGDISCEPNHEFNPLPFYSQTTTFENPTHRVWNQGKAIDIISIDNLPSFLPAESSEHFSRQLIGHINDLLNGSATNLVWKRAASIYHKNINKYFQFEKLMRKAI